MRFSALIHKIGINPVVDVPVRISRACGRRGYVSVSVKLGGQAFPANLVPVGGGRHRLYLNLPMRKAAGRDTGDRVTIDLQPDAARACCRRRRISAGPWVRRDVWRWQRPRHRIGRKLSAG